MNRSHLEWLRRAGSPDGKRGSASGRPGLTCFGGAGFGSAWSDFPVALPGSRPVGFDHLYE
jgi:hypothetical protein